MRWYFAIDERGAQGGTGVSAKLAVRSAAGIGGLEPVLLYYGKKTDFTAWMEREGVTVIHTEPRFLPAIRAAVTAGTYRPYSIGHWLRLNIPLIEQRDEMVLYTDCDVVFLRAFGWREAPKFLAAAPEFNPSGWGYFNGGVMLLNIPAMRATYETLERKIRASIAAKLTYNYDDQVALNEVYKDNWDRLDPMHNWKPYWGANPRATILHFHGPKLDALESIPAGSWGRDNPDGAFLANMVDAAIDGYIAWCMTLGDALQRADLPMALRFHNAAAGLLRYKPNMPANPDRSFLQRM